MTNQNTVDVRQQMLRQRVEGNGKEWQKRVKEACRQFGCAVEDICYSALKLLNPDWGDRRLRKETSRAVMAFNTKPKGRHKEPTVWTCVRSFVSLLFQHERPQTLIHRFA